MYQNENLRIIFANFQIQFFRREGDMSPWDAFVPGQSSEGRNQGQNTSVFGSLHGLEQKVSLKNLKILKPFHQLYSS